MKNNNRFLESILILLVGGSLVLAIVEKEHRNAFIDLTELTITSYICLKLRNPYRQGMPCLS